jgi:hypothetical protein
MKKALILILLVFSASLSNSQDRTAPITKVDWKEIGKFSRSHPDSIKVLITRMLRKQIDTTLSYRERLTAYVGQTYLSKAGSADLLLMDYNDSVSNKNYDGALRTALQAVKIYPLSLEANTDVLKMILLQIKDSTRKSDYTVEDLRYYYRITMRIMNTIAASGDGSKENPFAVISVGDEYDFMRNYLNIENGNQYLVGGTTPCDKFDVKEKSKYYQADDIYFDITRVLEMEKEMFER